MHKAFIITILILTIFGFLMVASSSSIESQQAFGTPYHLFIKQLIIGGVGGLTLFFGINKFIKVKLIKFLAFPVLSLMLLLLSIVFIPGLSFKYGGAIRWIDLGFFSFQPSEVAKIGLILFAAAWLSTRKKEITSLTSTFIPYFIIIGIPSVLILLQKDISTFIITFTALFVMIFLAGTKVRYLAGISILIIILITVAISVFPTRLNRVKVFLDPQIDPQGISYQVNQSLIAIGSGGLFGMGLGMSNQKFSYLPEPSGDSIFAIIAEELGFVGASLLVITYLILFVESIIIAKKADEFGKLFIYGFITIVMLQAFINIGSVTASMPFTGVTLPFISYGGTSIIMLLTGAGIVARIAKENGQVFKLKS